MTGRASIKRFYKDVSVAETQGGFEIRLDGKALKAESAGALLSPTRALADGIAKEWASQQGEIQRGTQKLTALMTAAQTSDEETAARWREEILAYLGSDLLCYRADRPDDLARRQAAAWDPYLNWFKETFGAALTKTVGVVAIKQPGEAIAAVRGRVEKASRPERLALRQATAITGSAVLALALWCGEFSPEDLFAASIVDETHQAEKWGWDAEAQARLDLMRGEFIQLAEFLRLLHQA